MTRPDANLGLIRSDSAAYAIIRLGLILESGGDSPAPISMTHTAEDNGKSYDTLWGIAALPSAGDREGCAAVDRFAARHHVPARWENGRYQAVMHLGGRYRYGVLYTPGRVLAAAPPAGAGTGHGTCAPAEAAA